VGACSIKSQGRPFPDRTHQVESHARFDHPVRQGCIRITIEGNDILAGGKLPVIQWTVEAHEIGRYRQVRRDRVQNGFLVIETGQPRIGAEAFPINFSLGLVNAGILLGDWISCQS